MSNEFPQWSRLSAWSVISFTFFTLKHLISNGYAFIPLFYTGWKQGFSSPWIIAALLLTLGFILGYSTLQWLKFSFKIESHKLNIKRGVLFKKVDEIPFSKIQNVRLQQPLYFRPMGLYSVMVKTAGSKGSEAILSALNYQSALRLKEYLITEQSLNKQMTHKDEAAMTAPHTQLVVRRDLKSLLLFGLYQNNAIWLVVILGPVFGQLDWIVIDDLSFLQTFWTWYDNDIATSFTLQVAFATLALALLYFLFSLVSMFSAVIKYFPYQLTHRNNTLHRTGGVLAKQNDALAMKRIQTIKFYQPLIGRIFNRWTVYFQQVKGHEIETHVSSNMLVPALKQTETTELLSTLTEIEANSPHIPKVYQRIHLGWLQRRILLPFYSQPSLAYFMV